jgi:GNAT superfamily N-acetyltransferase
VENLRVEMIRESLEDLPQFPVPAPCTLRWYRPGDEAAWLRIHLEADAHNTFTPRTFEEQFGRDPRVLAERQCYLCDAEGEAIGTTTAWFHDYRGRPFGRVHWVAIVPAMQGRGLANPLLTAVCNRLRALGHERAYLSSATVRVPALNLYLKFGFLPVVRTEEDLRAWSLVRPWIRPDYWTAAAAAVPELARGCG